VIYRWEFNSSEEEAAALLMPIEGQRALVAFMDALVFDPYDYARTKDEPVGRNMRFLDFGASGQVVVLIDERNDLVLIVQVAWV
jgi:hypothetical protein